MNSVFRSVKPAELFAEIRMLRQKHRGAFLLMEGAHDARRFGKFFDTSVALSLPCHGKDNVIRTIDLIQNAGFEDCLGFIDADFDRVENRVPANDDIIVSVSHDFDADICRSPVISRYLVEVGVEDRVAAAGGCDAIVASLLSALKPLSALRFANEKRNLRLSLKQLELSEFFDGTSINIDAMFDAVFTGALNTPENRAIARSEVDRYVAADIDLWQFTNGHDVIAALGVALRNRIGNRLPSQTWRGEVEKHLRLAFDWADFHATGLVRLITAWQERNAIGSVIRRVA